MTRAHEQPRRQASRPLIGREDELAGLVEVVSTVASSARLAVIEGEAGIGKTRLLRAALDHVPDGVRVVRGRGVELERDRPFGTIVDALGLRIDETHPGRRAAYELLSGGATLRSVPDGFPMERFRAVAAAVDLVGSWTTDGPVLLVVEDLHWVDDSSLLVIEQLARRLADQPLTIVATTRPSVRTAVVDTIRSALTSAGVLDVALRPLDQDAVVRLSREVLGAAPGPTLSSVVARAAGNPLFITELLEAVLADGTGVGDDGTVDIDAPAAPAALDVAILGQLGYLSGESIEVLRVASVLGSRFSLDDLSIVLEIAASDLLAPLSEPLATQLVVEADDALAFRHDLVRDAIYRDLPLAARRALHVQAARRLAESGRPATIVAAHYLEGAEPGDATAIAWLRDSAAAVVSLSPAIAADLLAGAVRLCGEDHPDRDAVLVDLLVAQAWAGRNADADELITALDPRPLPPALRARFELAAGHAVQLLGRERESLDRLTQLVDSPHLSERERARILATIGTGRLLVGDVEEGRRAADEACDRARHLHDDPALCGGLTVLCWVASVEGRTQDGIALGEEAVRLARTSPDRETVRRYPHAVLGSLLLDADRLEEGSRLHDEARRTAESLGDRFLTPVYEMGQALAEYYAGRLDDAEVARAAAVESADDLGYRVLRVWSLALGARIAIHCDDLERAHQLVEEADAEVAAVGPKMGLDWLLWCRALLAEAAGDEGATVAGLHTAWDVAGAVGIVAQGRLIGPDHVRVLLSTGDDGAAREVAARLERAAELSRTPGAAAAATRCRGLVERDPDLLTDAVELSRRSPRALEQAHTMRDAAQLLATSGRTDEARALFEEATALAGAAGAVRDVRTIEDALGTLGRRRRAARQRPTYGWESLTPTELEVARLAATGLSNPEIAQRRFVSPRTIETHLSNAFLKLGVSSRVALAAEVVRRDG